MIVWLLVLLLVILAIGGGVALSKFLFLILVVALILALLACSTGRRSDLSREGSGGRAAPAGALLCFRRSRARQCSTQRQTSPRR